jgi:small subunit ribosomal protein S7
MLNILRYKESVFKSYWLSKFISKWSISGRKSYLEIIIYYALYTCKKKFKQNPLFIFFEVIDIIKPYIGLQIDKHGTIPYVLNPLLQYNKSIDWLFKSIMLRFEKKLWLKIYNEFYNIILNNTTNSIIKKKDYYKYITMFKSIQKFKW